MARGGLRIALHSASPGHTPGARACANAFSRHRVTLPAVFHPVTGNSWPGSQALAPPPVRWWYFCCSMHPATPRLPGKTRTGWLPKAYSAVPAWARP
ncbi:hypothetical protein [Microbulbifer spongiae]|uniref:Uncharacterized protein n=1 Tax=Microbulbifer spongiae TaxID=2944933 RepID=A0ABY9EEU4_9GAMM|nr:hypothetical protein [Microbulbifer sp. MI-G]WKD50059.1 hypothetical protein M8T91_01125 [Microbulbifer sp. MI-G]